MPPDSTPTRPTAPEPIWRNLPPKFVRLTRRLRGLPLKGRQPTESDIAKSLRDWILKERRTIEAHTRETIAKSFPVEQVRTAAAEARLADLQDLVSQYPTNWGHWHAALSRDDQAFELPSFFAALRSLLDLFADLQKALDSATALRVLPSFDVLDSLIDRCATQGLSEERAYFNLLSQEIAKILENDPSVIPEPIASLLSDYAKEMPDLEKSDVQLIILSYMGHMDPGPAINAFTKIQLCCERLIFGSKHQQRLRMLNQRGALSRLCLFLHARALGCEHVDDYLEIERERSNPNSYNSTPTIWTTYLDKAAFRAVAIFCTSGEKLPYGIAALLSKAHHVLAGNGAEARITQTDPIDQEYWINLLNRKEEPQLEAVLGQHQRLREKDNEPVAVFRASRQQFMDDFPLRDWMHGKHFMKGVRADLARGEEIELAQVGINAVFTPWSTCWHTDKKLETTWFVDAKPKEWLKRLLTNVILHLDKTNPGTGPFQELKKRLPK